MPKSSSIIWRPSRVRCWTGCPGCGSSRWRGGPVNIDVAACKARRIRLVNTPGRNASAVAEFTIGAILAETRLIRAGHEGLRQGRWRGDLYRYDVTGAELSDMTVGIIGYGCIGT